MRAHILQHVPFEGPGAIAPWLEAAGHSVTRSLLFETAGFPGTGGLDLLVVMGGPMSAADEDGFAWLASEKRFIGAAIETGVPVLGICLGAQLIASALGARVYRSPVTEIGWFPVRSVMPEDPAVLRLPDSETVFHWHSDTFDLPAGAVRLAGSDGCENQAFQFGASVIGLQFHVETTRESLREMVAHGRAELTPGPYVQAEEDILGVGTERFDRLHTVMGTVLDYLCGPRVL